MKDHWYKRNPRDFYEATRALSLEERGAYSDIIDLLYMHDGSIPDDAKWLSHALHISTRKWAPIRAALLKAGKVQIVNGQIVNGRVSDELGSRAVQSRLKAESASNRERTKRENREKANKNNETRPQKDHYARSRDIETDKEKITTTVEQDAAHEAVAGAKYDFAKINVAVAKAAGRAMRATSASVHDISPIIGCLDAGADLDLDVLPTIERVAAGKPAGSLSGWGYFAKAIAEACAKRKAAATTVATQPKKLGWVEYWDRQAAAMRRELAGIEIEEAPGNALARLWGDVPPNAGGGGHAH